MNGWFILSYLEEEQISVYKKVLQHLLDNVMHSVRLHQ